MKRLFFFCILGICFFPRTLLSVQQDPILFSIYESRVDLQKAFDAKTGKAIKGSSAGFLIDLRDWAEQYGWQEYPERLSAHVPEKGTVPVKRTGIMLPQVQSHAYLVVDRQTGMILAEKKSTDVWPIASLTKLMTASVVLDQEISLNRTGTILSSDEVGGARLSVYPGTSFTINDLLYAALVGSANNAARALSHVTDLSSEEFIVQMNRKAQEIGMPHTVFVETSGIDTDNVSTAREMARLAMDVFEKQEMRRYTSTATHSIYSPSHGIEKKLTNTNWMLWKPEYKDVYVMSGKTGYLEESKWNLIVSLRPEFSDVDREVLVVLLGAQSRAESFQDAETLASWAWKNFLWDSSVH